MDLNLYVVSLVSLGLGYLLNAHRNHKIIVDNKANLLGVHSAQIADLQAHYVELSREVFEDGEE